MSVIRRLEILAGPYTIDKPTAKLELAETVTSKAGSPTNLSGILVSEYDTKLSSIQLRRPDIAYLTKNQVQLGKNGEDVIPEFIIEIISGTDNINKVEEKITEYFKSGVKVVWNIMPEQQLVYVYTSRKSVKICNENDICSASPVLKDFEISVNSIFQ